MLLNFKHYVLLFTKSHKLYLSVSKHWLRNVKINDIPVIHVTAH